MAKIESAGQKQARLEKEYLHSDRTSDTKVWMADWQESDFCPVKEYCFVFCDQVKICLK